MSARGRVLEAYEAHYGGRPAALARAPGRVNLIGDHTDYNEGYALPMAIDRSVWIALEPASDRRVEVHALDYDERAAFGLNSLERGEPRWISYLEGVAWALQEAGHRLEGWRGVLAGDVPVGGGLASSAALELACARAFWAASQFEWEPGAVARLCQRAENEWVGVACGIMDPLVCAAATPGHALWVDCRSLRTEPVPLPHGSVVAVLDTGTRRGLAASAYNARRAECEQAARALGVTALRDVNGVEFEARASGLEPTLRRRARHVVTENARVLAAAEDLRAEDASAFGELMNASHASLREDFEVSSAALEAAVECARAAPGCYGARLTGAGFAGCAVALVEAAAASEMLQQAAACFEARTGRTASFSLCTASAGAETVEVEAD